MTTGNLYTLTQAAEETGERRALLSFLIRDRQIPSMIIGNALVIDEDGLTSLKGAVAVYRERTMSAPEDSGRKRVGRPRKPAATAG